MAFGLLRLARQWDAAEALSKTPVPAEWADAWANEEAALLWQRGHKEEAARRWQTLPESVPVLFNRGMAALFLGRPADARADLRKAVVQAAEGRTMAMSSSSTSAPVCVSPQFLTPGLDG